ncbi:MAG: hypothetical protein AB2541_02830 [Candidatus Thiodiazotropha sp.]
MPVNCNAKLDCAELRIVAIGRAIRGSPRFSLWKYFIAVLILLLSTTSIKALTGGPTEPAMSAPEALSTSELVDPFTGDFQYQIPLIELPGPHGSYPLTLSYRSGITTEEEASWIGLGWNLESGRISRKMHGVPDDIAGQYVYQLFHQRPAIEVGAGGTVGAEVFGLDSRLLSVEARLGLDVFFNSYSGYGLSFNLSPKANFKPADNLSGSLGVAADLNTQHGTTVNANLGLNLGIKSLSPSYGASYSPKTGLESAYWGYGQIPLFSPSYIATSQRSQWGQRSDFSIKVGAELWGVFPSGELKGYDSTTTYEMSVKKPAFGYLYLHEGLDQLTDSQLDFVREKDSPLKPTTPYLPFAILTADKFSLALPNGPYGEFRAFRSDLPVVGDPITPSTNFSENTAGEVGVGSLAHMGGSADRATAENVSSGWYDNLFAVYARSVSSAGESDERTYFTLQSELTTESAQVSSSHLEEPKFIELSSARQTKWRLQGLAGEQAPPVSSESQHSRKTFIRSVTESEALQPIWRAKFNHQGVSRPASNSGATDERIAGYEVVGAEGTRYIFAQPAYVSTEANCIFSVDPRHPDDDLKAEFLRGQTLVNVPKKTDQVIKKWFNWLSSSEEEDMPELDLEGSLPNTTDQFLSCTSTPSYAHSYYLTSVLGPNYIDADSTPGPSQGDMGHWVRFEYENVSDYLYRSPYDGAHYSRGYENSYLGDDRGTLTIGLKNVFFLRRAFTATHKLEFSLKDRIDAWGFLDPDLPDGSQQSLKRLSKIELFHKDDQQIPIKTVFFDNDHYELAKGIPNFDPDINRRIGKLTLKKVWFEYGLDASGKNRPYSFSYSSTAEDNPDYIEENWYGDKNSDRWGYYQRCSRTPSYSEVIAQNERCSNGDSPYTLQGNDAANYSSVWSLKSINTPSGARIDIFYEADDYAYVQDERAGIFVNTCNAEKKEIKDKDHADPRLCIDLSSVSNDRISAPTTEEEAEAFVNGLLDSSEGRTNQLAFVADVKLRPDGPMWETVEGYLELGDKPTVYRCIDDNCEASISLKRVKGEYHPIAFSGWQHLKLNQPQYAIPGVSPMGVTETNDVEELRSAAEGLVNMVFHIHDTFTSYAEKAKKEGWANEVRNIKVRLFEPSGFKRGGGARVRKITICDATNYPNDDCNDPQYAIGKTYSYNIVEDGRLISSGVAAYEPSVGGDEISLRTADFYDDHRILAPSEPAYFEHPIAESLFPAPVVGYRRVIERTLASEYANQYPSLNVATSGEREYEFYTAKDFPVRVKASILHKKTDKDLLQLPGIGTILEERFASSIGYRVELNDMSGKIRRVADFATKSDGTRADGIDRETIYHYNVHPDSTNRLDSNSLDDYLYKPELQNDLDRELGFYIYPVDGQKRGTLGQRVEYYADMRQSGSSTNSTGFNVNVDTLLGLVPIPIPVPWPSYDDSKKESRTSVFHQIIHQNGVLLGVERKDQSAYKLTKNTVFDPALGESVLVMETNAFGDPEYTLDIPAYWLHPLMGPIYSADNNKNILVAKSIQMRSASNPFSSPPFRCGDNKQYKSYTSGGRVFVPKKPLVVTVNDVLDTTLSLYWNRGLIDRDLLSRSVLPSIAADVENNGGPWLPIAKYHFDAERLASEKPNPKVDGRYKKPVVIPIADLVPGDPISAFSKLIETCAPGWKQAEYISKYHPQGPPVESIAPLHRHDAVLYTRKGGEIHAVAQNAEYSEIGYEGFESYKNNERISSQQLDDGNIDFWSDNSTSLQSSEDVVIVAVNVNNSMLEINDFSQSISRDILRGLTFPLKARLHVFSDKGESLCHELELVDVKVDDGLLIAETENPLQYQERSGSMEIFIESNSATQYLQKPSKHDVTRCPRAQITDRVAHTGKRALAVHSSSCFEQNRLKLNSDRYVLSAWISQWNTDVPTYEVDKNDVVSEKRGVGIKYKSSTSNICQDQNSQKLLFEPKGPVIDGWQRVEGEFLVSEGNGIALIVQTGNNGVLYIDDLRIYPSDSKLNTFVYDSRLRLLSSRHDENNISTRWQYDQAGQLRFSERETERGWRTATEQILHQAESRE